MNKWYIFESATLSVKKKKEEISPQFLSTYSTSEGSTTVKR